MSDMKKQVVEMIEKAGKAEKSDDALKFFSGGTQCGERDLLAVQC